ncbi:hypothetical protein LWI28_021269 [Acer negundo]|uniref:Uncharacterized protein n=1 Tax=Acer negundo TaxID=4023 RepID=A0AAD5JRU4_ACENE|nr:hypothetical protein LWI28_021269 [Acer negundo]
MTFKQAGKSQTFYGLKHSPLAPIFNKELQQITGMGFLLHMVPSSPVEEFNSLPTDMTQLLTEFSHVFSTPTQLPPVRTQDHQIPLQPGHGPVSVRPYRYPFYQKTEIEKMVVPETLEPSLAVTSRCSCTASTPDVISITITTSIEEVSSNAKPIIRQIQKAPKRIKKLLDMLFQQEVNEEEASLFDMFWLLPISVMFVPLFQKIPYGI